MRYMMIIKASPDSEAGKAPNAAIIAGMAKLSEEAMKSGKLLAQGGLAPSALGTRIRYSRADGKRTVVDGPFSETKELLGGFAIFEVESKEEAIALANQCVDVHVDAGISEFNMELRPMFCAGECPSTLESDALQAAH